MYSVALSARLNTCPETLPSLILQVSREVRPTLADNLPILPFLQPPSLPAPKFAGPSFLAHWRDPLAMPGMRITLPRPLASVPLFAVRPLRHLREPRPPKNLLRACPRNYVFRWPPPAHPCFALRTLPAQIFYRPPPQSAAQTYGNLFHRPCGLTLHPNVQTIPTPA